MDRVEIARAIAQMDGRTVIAAAAARGLPATRKDHAAAALTEEVFTGRMTLHEVQMGHPSTTARPVPAQVDPRIEAAAAAASRAESVALSVGSRLDKVADQLTRVTGVTQTTEQMLGTLCQEVQGLKSTKADPAVLAQAIRAEVAQAFGPIRAAAESNATVDQVKVAAAAGPVARVPVVQAFGIEVSDIKGNQLMVDIYDHADAPMVDPHFIWTESILRALCCAADTGANLWMGGEKGTGKTQTAEQFAARTGRTFNRVNFHKYSTAEQFIGATGLEAGQTVFKLGEFTSVFCEVPGSITLLDEPSNCDPGEMAQFNALLEPNGRVNLGGAIRSRAMGALCFAADNTMGCGDVTGRYTGTRVQNAALLDRFALKVPFTFLPIEQEIHAVTKHTGCSNALAAGVMAVVVTARAKVSTGDVVDAPSIRQVVAWIRAMPYLGVRGAWDRTIAASQPVESAIAMEAIYQAEVNESALATLL